LPPQSAGGDGADYLEFRTSMDIEQNNLTTLVAEKDIFGQLVSAILDITILSKISTKIIPLIFQILAK
jgi:hypothetical protein